MYMSNKPKTIDRSTYDVLFKYDNPILKGGHTLIMGCTITTRSIVYRVKRYEPLNIKRVIVTCN